MEQIKLDNYREGKVQLIKAIWQDFRLKVMVTIIIAMGVGIIYRVYNITFNPEYTVKANLQWMAREPRTLELLNDHLKNLNNISENIDSYSIKDIKKSVKDTLVLVNLSNKELNSQYEAWLSIKGTMENDRAIFDKMRNDMNNIKEIKTEQVLAIKGAIDKAYAPSFMDHIFTHIITFILGIFSSIFATILFKKYINKLPNKV